VQGFERGGKEGRGDVLGSFEGGLYGALSDDASADLETMLEEDLLGTLDFLLRGCHTGDVGFRCILTEALGGYSAYSTWMSSSIDGVRSGERRELR